VTTNIQGAEIYVDGNYYGSGPAEIPLPAGTHGILVQKEGFAPFRRSVTLPANATIAIHAELAP
jgi:hypothetical protein